MSFVAVAFLPLALTDNYQVTDWVPRTPWGLSQTAAAG